MLLLKKKQARGITMDYKAIDLEFNAFSATIRLKIYIFLGSLTTLALGILILIFSSFAPDTFFVLGNFQHIFLNCIGIGLIILGLLTLIMKSRICSTLSFLCCVPYQLYQVYLAICHLQINKLQLMFIFMITAGMCSTFIYQYKKKQFRLYKLNHELIAVAQQQKKLQAIHQDLSDFKRITDKKNTSSYDPSLFEDDSFL